MYKVGCEASQTGEEKCRQTVIRRSVVEVYVQPGIRSEIYPDSQVVINYSCSTLAG